jgi:hypothetical protein
VGLAFEMTRVSLRLADVSDPLNKIVAEKIIELAQAGERDPNGLCERTLSFFRVQRLGPNKGGCVGLSGSRTGGRQWGS